MSEWKTYKMFEIGQVVGGATPSTKNPLNYDGDIAWLTPKDLSSFSDRYIERGERDITEEGYNSCSTKMLPQNTVLFSSRAPIGYIAIAKNELCTNQGFKSVIPGPRIDYMFLYYLLKYKKNDIENMGSGTTFKEVSGNVMKNIEVSIPDSIDEQKKIAGVLDRIDSKIEINNAINRNLSEQAKTVFKEWFINNPDSDKWPIGTFSDLIMSTLGGDWGKETETGNYTEMVYCVRGADIPEVNAGNKGKMPTRFILPKNFKSKQLVAGDIVVEISGGSPTQSTGRVASVSQSLLDRYDKGMVCTNFCRAIKPKTGYSMFVYYYWQYLYDRGVFFLYENGTTGIKNLDISGFLSSEEIIIPPKDLVDKFDDLCQSIFKQVFKNGISSEKLAQTRDGLLPKLMSGEIDVAELDI